MSTIANHNPTSRGAVLPLGALLLTATLLTGACADAPPSQRGAGVGAALGSGIALATGAGAAGVIGGGLIGGAVGYAGGWAAGGR
jgi:hypothetical protein